MPLSPDKKLEDADLDAFRKETGNGFYVPENHIMFAQIANTDLWLREVFVWKYKKNVAAAVKELRERITRVIDRCDPEKEGVARGRLLHIRDDVVPAVFGSVGKEDERKVSEEHKKKNPGSEVCKEQKK